MLKCRPAVRSECIDVPRPCPFVSCRYHLYLDVMPHSGRIRFNFPGLEVDEIPVSCALDEAEANIDGLQLEGVAVRAGNITRERVRQLQDGALVALYEGLMGDEK